MHALNLFFSLCQPQPPEGKNQKVSTLTPDEFQLYSKIVKDLLRFYEERVEHPQLAPGSQNDSGECALIFRKPEPWNKPEEMFNNIKTTDAKISTWVNSWLKRIKSMRGWQNQIHHCAAQLQTYKDDMMLLMNSAYSKDQITKIQSEEITIKKKVASARKQINNALTVGKQDLAQLDSKISRNPFCKKVVDFLTENWLHLTVFAEWPEVSVDDDKIAVQVQHLKGTSEDEIPFEKLLNRSTQGIFLIKEAKIEETPIEYEGEKPGKIIRPTKIELKETHLSSQSPSPKTKSAAMLVTDEILFGVQFAKSHEVVSKTKDISRTARKLERLVGISLTTVNQRLEQNALNCLI